tara:strand:+ start:1055 stop:1336 length:282 start_codon:yes stop_codon:yes gene_type:complete
MEKYQKNIVTFPIERQMDKIVREAKRLEKRSKELIGMYKKTHSDITGKTVIYSESTRVRCSGQQNDHPLVYYTIPEGGHVVCGYCDLVYMKSE